jgi:hypothetical protein
LGDSASQKSLIKRSRKLAGFAEEAKSGRAQFGAQIPGREKGFTKKTLILLVGGAGFEPATPGL